MPNAKLTHLDHQHRWNNERSKVWHHWSRAIPLAEAVAHAGTSGGPPYDGGAYVLSLAGRDAPIKLHRLLGVDAWAVLDIGESTSLGARIESLSKCASRARASGHMAGWRYAYLKLAEKLAPHTLLISWRSHADSYRLEAETMTAYLNAFGELPPLNYKANWSLLA
jgi:hypothetical protein